MHVLLGVCVRELVFVCLSGWMRIRVDKGRVHLRLLVLVHLCFNENNKGKNIKI